MSKIGLETLSKTNSDFRCLLNKNFLMREKGKIDYDTLWSEYSKEVERRWDISSPETEWVTLFWASNTFFLENGLSEYQIKRLAEKNRFRYQMYDFPKTDKKTKEVTVEKRMKVCLQDLEFYKLLLDLSKEFQNAELQRIVEHNETGEEIMEYVPLKQNKLGLSMPDVQISVLLQQLSNAKIAGFIQELADVRQNKSKLKSAHDLVKSQLDTNT